MSDWLKVLLAPDSLNAAVLRRQFTPQGATSLLLDGHVGLYLSLCDESSPLPPPEAAESASPEYRLASALLMYLTGQDGAPLLRRAVEDGSANSDERMLAAILRASMLATTAHTRESVESLLMQVSLEGWSPLQLAFLRTQVGARLLELGEWAAASENVRLAKADLASLRGTDPLTRQAALALRSVNDSNSWFIEQLSEGTVGNWPSRARRRHLDRVSSLIASGLESDVERTFETRFADTSVRTIRWSSEDAAERALSGALLRAETWADYQNILRARRNLGRYILASQVGLEDARPERGLELLSLATEAEALRRASQALLARGPITSLAGSAKRIAQSEWVAPRVPSLMKFFTVAADVLDEAVVEQTLRRIWSEYPSLAKPTALGRADFDVLDAIAALTKVASVSTQTAASEWACRLAESGEPRVLHSLPAIVSAIDWSRQTSAELGSWLTIVETQLAQSGQAASMAEQIAYALSHTRPSLVLNIIRRFHPNSPELIVCALQGDGLASLRDEEINNAADALVAGLEGTRSAAARGSFAFGRFFYQAEVLAGLLLARPTLTQWSSLLSFLSDEKVSAGDKTRAVRRLAQGASDIPDAVRRGLADIINSVDGSTAGRVFGEDEAPFLVAVTELKYRLGVSESSDVFSLMMRLAVSSDMQDRRWAAPLAVLAADFGHTAGLVALLMLSGDHEVPVRSSALTALVQYPVQGSGDTESLVWPRINEALSHPSKGGAVAVLQGLLHGERHRRDLPQSVRSRITAIHRDHHSWTVRHLAGRVIDQNRMREATPPE